MELSAKLAMNGEDRPVDVTDKTVAKNHVWDFPVPALANVRQSLERGNTRGFASRLAP